MKKAYLFAISILIMLPQIVFAGDITIALSLGELASYRQFLQEKGGDPLAIRDFASDHSTRPSTSLVLIKQALHLGGWDELVRFKIVPNYARAVLEVKSGRATILGQDAWREDFDDSVFMSEPVVRRGEFRKAIYGRADNKKLMQVDSLDKLRQFRALTGLCWTLDIRTLAGMGIKQTVYAPRYDLHFNMLLEGRADFGLLELSNNDYMNGPLPQGLTVIEGLAVGLDDSRHFMISRHAPNGPEAYKALSRGLAILRKQGRIKKALTECGFINATLKGWKQIYP